ncbi:MAG: hypothetical protein Q4G66_11910 [bacterium]|nr:hypothetical protein [bacterium]
MSNPTVSATVTTPETPQIKPQSFTYCFAAPRDDNAPYPPYSLRAAEELLFQAKAVPPSLAALDENFLCNVYHAWEHVDAAVTLAGILYRALEQEGSRSLSLARALCLALAEAHYGVEMIDESTRAVILKAFGREVK